MYQNLDDEIFSFKQDLLGSRNYYSELWARYKIFQRLLMLVNAIAALLTISTVFDLNSLFVRAILLIGIVVSAFKEINTLPQRIKDLCWQYRECQDIVNCLDKGGVNFDTLAKLKNRFAKVEKKDYPTIECLMAVCMNKALVCLGVRQRYSMTWFERKVGIYLSCVKYDDHAELIDIQ